MSSVICIAGESGSGKTTAMRTLDPAQTYYIDADGKGLSWRGWRSAYNAQNKNYCATNDISRIKMILRGVSDKRPEIKQIIIDTINGVMVADEMRRAREKGYDKWMDLAACIWDIVDSAYGYRDDLTIVFAAHTQTERDESGYQFTRIKTSGRKLDKICLESKFTTVLLAKCIDGRFIFETRANNSTAKSPLGMFDEPVIDNDMQFVINALKCYETA